MTNSDTGLSHREENQTFKKKKSSFVNVPGDPKCGRKFCSFSSRVNESIHGKQNKEFFPGKHSIGSSPAMKQVVNKCKQRLLSLRQCWNGTGRLPAPLCAGTFLPFRTGWESFFAGGARCKGWDAAGDHRPTVPPMVLPQSHKRG